MAEYLTRNLKLAISAAVEASYNTMRVASGDLYYGFQTTARNFYIPDKEKLDDTGKIGTGREWATNQRSGYISVPSLEITDELNIDIAAVLLRRAMGGTDASPVVIPSDAYYNSDATATESTALALYNHSWGMMTGSSRQLPSSSLLWSLGGADYIWGGVCIDTFKIDQTQSNVPTFSATMVGSGLNKRLSYLTANGEVVVNGSNVYTGPYPNTGAAPALHPPVFPAPTLIPAPDVGDTYPNPVQRYMLGAETKVKFTDPTGTLVLTDAQRLKSFSLTLSNNIRTDDKRPGDPRLLGATGNPKAGHYVNRLLHGDRQVAAEYSIMLDETLREFSDAYDDNIITNFVYTAAGDWLHKYATPYTVSTTDHQATFEVTLPKAYFRSVRGSDDNGDAIITISIFPVDDLVNGPMTAKMSTNKNTAIV